jgi:hypothetical protein
VAKYEKTITGQFDHVLDHLRNDISNSGMSTRLVDESYHSSGNTQIAVLVYDKYFMRNGNRASLSLTVVGYGREVFISAIGSGGGQGIFLNFSLGAEDNLVAIVQKSVEQWY